MLNRNIVNFIGCEAEYEEADIVIFGAPFDSAASCRPGARYGSRAIREESYSMETYSPYQGKDLKDYRIFDSGDLVLPIGDAKKVVAEIQKCTETIFNDGKIPFMIGGDHLVTLGSICAAAVKYPDLHLIHFDAHADLKEDHLGVHNSHACVIRKCWEILGDGRIFQFGIRSGSREEFRWAQKGHVRMNKFNLDGLSQIIKKLEGKPVYITVDLDVLDPAIFPGTGMPEAGGITFIELMNALIETSQGSYVVGCDVNELSPAHDTSGASTAVAGKIVREFLLALQK